MPDEIPPADPTPEAPNDLEFKPWVRISAWSALGLTALGLAYYAFYSWGYSSGKREAIESSESQMAAVLKVAVTKDSSVVDAVAQRMEADRAAAEKSRSEKESVQRSLQSVLQVRDADRELLRRMVTDRAVVFSGISEPSLRREVQGVLLSSLMDRGMLAEVQALLPEVMPPAAPENPVWAQRMLRAAQMLAQHDCWQQARAYLEHLAEALPDAELLRTWADLAMSCIPESLAVQRELYALSDRAKALGDASLMMELSVILGQLCRELGDEDRAREHFTQAVQAMEQAKPTSGAGALFYGVALFESGDKIGAFEYLKKGLDTTERIPGLSDCRAVALRHLATLSSLNGRHMQALHYLSRAEGEATGMIHADSSFWPYLAEQRGWTLYAMREYDDALAEFRAAIAAARGQEAMHSRPMEGVALCYLALGSSDESIQTARACVELHDRVLPESKTRRGQMYILLGQAYDQDSKFREAAEQYSRAAELLPAGEDEHAVALESCAQALTQAQDWTAAAAAWSRLISALPESASSRRNSAQKNLQDCQAKLKGEAAPSSPKTDSRPQRSSRRRRSRR